MDEIDRNKDACQNEQQEQVFDEVWHLVEESAKGPIFELKDCDHLY
jgi:hypothetical protein